MRNRLFTALACAAFLALLPSCRKMDGQYSLQLLATGDIHGCYFDGTYVTERTKPSLLAVKYLVDSVRNAAGKENVILIDAGDFLQGDNAAYYFNYVDSTSGHVYPKMAAYMGYDAVTVGNHDIETGHEVYDRIAKDLSKKRISFLAGNAITKNGRPYFKEYTVFRKNGVKVLVLGYTNPNISSWLGEELWSGMEFKSLIPTVQKRVNRLTRRFRPDVVIVSVHSGVGPADGSVYESQGWALFDELTGVDVLICGHDHVPCVMTSDNGSCLVDGGSHCKNIGHVTINLDYKDGKLVGKKSVPEIIPVDKGLMDKKMKRKYSKQYEAVRNFTLKPVGYVTEELRSRDAYAGQSLFLDFIHGVQIAASGADVSFAAPLGFDNRVKAGEVVYNDLFSIYPYENTLYKISMYGREIVDYLEYSYDKWINTWVPGGHILKIAPGDDSRTGSSKWHFVNRTYNFDSAAGIDYTVDIRQNYGSRINVISMADGKPFDYDAEYSVALSSYRFNGGGGILVEGANISKEDLEGRVLEKYPEIRNLIFDYFLQNGTLSAGCFPGVGHWEFIPNNVADKVLAQDMNLLF